MLKRVLHILHSLFTYSVNLVKLQPQLLAGGRRQDKCFVIGHPLPDTHFINEAVKV